MTVITSMHFVIAVVLSIFIYRERPTPLGMSGIVLTGCVPGSSAGLRSW
ncbi:MAG: hypothetical protein M0C28_21545 [Candidatus Moduliflexus flocculans]|nr:hypothetical protein [Candidatus Moduliflexus flocculans]